MPKNDPKPAQQTRYPLGTRTYALAIALNLLTIAAQVGRFLRLRSDLNVWYGLTAALVLCGTVVLALFRSALADRRRAQQARDGRLAIRADMGYGVFLRPFRLDATLRLENPFFRFWFANYDEIFRLFPGEYVGRVLEPYFPVVEIGGSDTTVGSARVQESDADWQSTFRALVDGAAFVVIMPLLLDAQDRRHGEATLWEFGELAARSALDRVVVFMPRMPGFGRSAMARAWACASAIVAGHGIALPAYTHRGGIFRLVRDDHGTWRASADHAVGRYRTRALAAGLVAAARTVAASRTAPVGRGVRAALPGR